MKKCERRRAALRAGRWALVTRPPGEADGLADEALAVCRHAREGRPGCPIHWFATDVGAAPEAVASLDARV